MCDVIYNTHITYVNIFIHIHIRDTDAIPSHLGGPSTGRGMKGIRTSASSLLADNLAAMEWKRMQER